MLSTKGKLKSLKPISHWFHVPGLSTKHTNNMSTCEQASQPASKELNRHFVSPMRSSKGFDCGLRFTGLSPFGHTWPVLPVKCNWIYCTMELPDTDTPLLSKLAKLLGPRSFPASKSPTTKLLDMPSDSTRSFSSISSSVAHGALSPSSQLTSPIIPGPLLLRSTDAAFFEKKRGMQKRWLEGDIIAVISIKASSK